MTPAMHPNLAGMFGGLQQGPGGTFMQATGMGDGAQLAGEADVMMISGLGQSGAQPAVPGGVPVGQPTLSGQLQFPVTLGTLTLPLWQWLLIAALLGGAGGYYLGRR